MTSDPGAGRRSVPPIVIAGAVAAVVLALAITFGILTGKAPLPHCTPTPGVTTGPLACATPTPSGS